MVHKGKPFSGPFRPRPVREAFSRRTNHQFTLVVLIFVGEVVEWRDCSRRRTSLPLFGREEEGGGCTLLFNVPCLKVNMVKRSRSGVHRARLARLKAEAVTQRRSSCPLRKKIRWSGHAGAFIVPTSIGKRRRRSRSNV